MWVRGRAATSEETVSSVPARFRADSGTNLFKQGEIVAGRPCGSVAQFARVLARCSRGPGFGSRSRAPCAVSSPVTEKRFRLLLLIFPEMLQ